MFQKCIIRDKIRRVCIFSLFRPEYGLYSSFVRTTIPPSPIWKYTAWLSSITAPTSVQAYSLRDIPLVLACSAMALWASAIHARIVVSVMEDTSGTCRRVAKIFIYVDSHAMHAPVPPEKVLPAPSAASPIKYSLSASWTIPVRQIVLPVLLTVDMRFSGD